MVNHCKVCKHWDGPAEVSVHNRGGLARCKHPKMISDKISDGAIDSESYGGIFTGPEFGCVHFEVCNGR